MAVVNATPFLNSFLEPMMPLTLLIDLDSTLLSNDINQFIPAYLKTLSEQLLPESPGLVAREVLAATRKMVENKSPDLTLEDVFDSHFYAAIGKTKQRLASFIQEFYTNTFPKLKYLTSPWESAQIFIERILQDNPLMAVATNPVFPLAATRKRLEWADLPVEEKRFSIISSYENFHFTKPSPAYYAEMMGQLGWPAGPVVMIGDDYDMDIIPASLLNIPAYWLQPSSAEPVQPPPPLIAKGDFNSVPGWIAEISRREFENPGYVPKAVLAILRSTPAVVDTLCRNHPKNEWHRRNKDNNPSPMQTIVHLLDADQIVNLPFINQFLRQINPPLADGNPGDHPFTRTYHQEDPRTVLNNFLIIRKKLLNALENIQDDSWDHTASFPNSGVATLLEYCNHIARQDQYHIRQLICAFS